MNSKIKNDIKELVEKQVISRDVASKIEAFYQAKQIDTPNRLFVVFGVLGSLLVGLGVILILAHNWDDFSKTTRTIFAFLPLIIGQFFVGYSILKKKSVAWKEASGTFLFFAVGASMALISQIYNIPGDISSYLLTWILLCVPLMYLLKSHTLAILHIVFATSYACSLGYFTGDESPWFYLLLVVLMLPHYLQLVKHHLYANITSVFNWLLPLSITIVLGAYVRSNEEFGFLIYVILFGLFYNLGKLPLFDNQKIRRNGYLVLGSLGTVYMLLLSSFKWFWKDVFRADIEFNSQEFYISIILFLITLGVLLISYYKKQKLSFNLYQSVFVLFTALFFVGLATSVLPIICINLTILSLGVIAVKIGVDSFHFGVLNYGLLIITALIACRFFDTNMSFVIRGLLFVGVGVGFFITNYVMLKKQKIRATNIK